MFRLVTARIALIGAGWFCDSAFAAETGNVVISPLATLGKLAIALILVLLVFWVFARVMRQLQGARGVIHSGLKVVGALSLGQRERVVVVQAGDAQLVLGVTATQINTLHVLTTPLSNNGTAEIGDFRQKLSAALKRQVAD
ncbi:flagellar biosynthetic protein FliO [Granulosicoccus antarcticus]|uniref:Flagellar protein n=1 Tax=Granulosicoccus antarcticus IMCC3135 TaxID=1192854 RepID=A0A2Z2NK57_9GAMM|nr:flagellar biosynthetic protein FliO [Granulosicoccus antarcticus]ASJ71782.1 Flagellar protein FliO [Granulosicoccus antarcticus IMCC3135]